MSAKSVFHSGLNKMPSGICYHQFFLELKLYYSEYFILIMFYDYYLQTFSDISINNQMRSSRSMTLPSQHIFNSRMMADLTCQICQNQFNETDHCPMIICTNQHTVCQDCLSTIRTTRKCPYCKVLFNQLNVSKNRTLLNLLDSLNYASVKTERKTEEKVKNFQKKNPEESQLKEIVKEAQEHNYQELVYMIYTHQKTPFTSRTEFREQKRSITKIIDLSLFKNMTKLMLNDNKIKVIENLHCLPLLINLNLHDNQISKIQGLDKIPFLKQLNLRKNKISKIENLDNLPKLEILGLGWNSIKVIQNLSNLPELKELGLSENKIEKMENLEQLKKLQLLILPNNKIKILEGVFFGNRALKTINLKNNFINEAANWGAIKAAKQKFSISF